MQEKHQNGRRYDPTGDLKQQIFNQGRQGGCCTMLDACGCGEARDLYSMISRHHKFWFRVMSIRFDPTAASSMPSTWTHDQHS
jgi:hypothetical protein